MSQLIFREDLHLVHKWRSRRDWRDEAWIRGLESWVNS